MGRHIDSPDAIESALSDVTVPSSSIQLTRRQLREAAMSASSVALDIPSTSPAAQEMPSSRSLSRQASGPSATAPTTATPRTAPARGISANAKSPQRRRRLAPRFLTATAMVFVAAIAVATSVPANALLSAKDVESFNGTQGQDVVTLSRNGQSLEASGENVVAGRDGVSVSGAEPVKAYTDVSSNRITPVVPNSTGPILWPFPAQVPLTDGFGPRVGIWTYGGYTGNFHSGLDFDPGAGTPIQAVADGIVTEVSASLCGQAVVIAHNVNGEKFESEYCHMIYGSPGVSVGQSIKAGTIIGNVGATGMATGPHLHLEIHIDGNSIDPFGFLKARSTAW